MIGNETQEFLEWKRGFNWEDDGLHAFQAIKKLAAIEFELAVRGEGYVDRIKQITDGS